MMVLKGKNLENYKKNLFLSKEQRDIIVGLMLGDGHLETQNQGNTFRLCCSQSYSKKDYVDFLYDVFKEWVLTPVRIRDKKSKFGTFPICEFKTLSHSSFRFYGQQFYSKERKKVIPKLLHRWLTPRALAIWYMDDGSLKSQQTKGVLLNTQGFTRKEVKFLCNILKDKFSIECHERYQKEGYQIYIKAKSSELFFSLIKPYLLRVFYYKVPKQINILPKE